MDRGAWRATAHGVTKSWTRLTVHSCTLILAGPSWSSNCLFFPSQPPRPPCNPPTSAGLQTSPESLLLAGSTVSFFFQLCPRGERWRLVGAKARASVTGESMFLFQGLHNRFIWLTWASILFLTKLSAQILVWSSLYSVLFIYLFSGEEGCCLLETIL